MYTQLSDLQAELGEIQDTLAEDAAEKALAEQIAKDAQLAFEKQQAEEAAAEALRIAEEKAEAERLEQERIAAEKAEAKRIADEKKAALEEQLANLDTLSQEEQDRINAEFTAQAVEARINDLENDYAIAAQEASNAFSQQQKANRERNDKRRENMQGLLNEAYAESDEANSRIGELSETMNALQMQA